MKTEKIICIHQPDFLPYLGFFDRLLLCDTFVILDNVQFLRRGWHHRDQIKTAQGVHWLTVPVQKKHRYHQLINETKIEYQTAWKHKHLALIEASYRKAEGFAPYFDELERIYQGSFEFLIELNMALLEWLWAVLDLSIEVVWASSLSVTQTGSLRLAEIVEQLSGTTYLSGTGARAYLDETVFEAHGISVQWQEFHHPLYPQLHGEFLPNLSILDCLLNCGKQTTRVLRNTHEGHRAGLRPTTL